ncbi:MAG: sulfatase [Candidatus Aminicenantes bacterium]|nr:sulfatase [Candidatus Aminicenantes bacterium]
MCFITEGSEQNFSFWFNPVLYNKGKNDRNIILISIDTLRADHLGCYGYDRDTSPNIDSLASDSALFLNTYASSPWTLPSHVSLLTSLHGVHHQVYYDREKMDPAVLTLADILRQNNFSCSSLTGGGFVSSVYGFSKGFDTYHDGVGGIFQQDSAELLFRAVLEWIEREKDKNFFLFLHTYQTHNPYACPYPYKTMFTKEGAKWRHIDLVSYLGGKPGLFKRLPEEERQNIIDLYDGEIRYTDEKFIGPLIGKLKEMELYDQTMIIFTSDHGEEFYDHKGWGHGHSLYDESLKVPLVIKFPGSKFKGKEIGNIVSLVDVMPTVLEEMGIDFSDLNIDGRSLFPVIEGKEKGDRTFLADIGSNVLNSRIPQKISMNMGKDKLILNKKFSTKDLDFFLYAPPALKPIELYDLKQDSIERKDIADKKSVLVNQIIRQINEIYSKAKKRKISRPEIDEELLEQLKALGYIR